jgi:hypothetical protein
MNPGFLLAHNLAIPCLGRKSKARVTTLDGFLNLQRVFAGTKTHWIEELLT